MTHNKPALQGRTITGKDVQAGTLALLLGAAALNLYIGEFAVGAATLALATAAIWLWLYVTNRRLRQLIREQKRTISVLADDIANQNAATLAAVVDIISRTNEAQTAAINAETKRVVDKFTQKSVKTTEREIEQLSQGFAAELRSIREESLAAAEVRLRMLNEIKALRDGNL